MTATLRMYDAAYPPSSPPHWEVCAAYIGGDTPHVWTAAEWARQPARYRLPIWVRSNPSGLVARAARRLRLHPLTRRPAIALAKAVARMRARTYAVSAATDAPAAVAWLKAHNAPKGTLVALDLETAVNSAYVRAFDAALVRAGYKVCAYGSASTVVHNPRPSGGYWTASWTGSPHIQSGAVATQYASDVMLHTSYDASLIYASAPLWDTHAPAPAPTPAPPPVQEDDMAIISANGAEGTKQVINAGQSATLTLNKTYDDGHKFRHGNLILANGWYKLHATAQVFLSGLAAGDVVRVAWERTSPDGKTAVDEPLVLPFTAGADGTVKVLLPWQMEVTSKLAVSLKVYNDSKTKPLTVDGAVLECDFFKIA